MKLSTALKLGRVSNLPTVWSNVLAGLVLAGGALTPSVYGRLGLMASLLYVGGMFLNDYCDAEIDAKERAERPIPSGEVRAGEVLRAVGLLFVLALVVAGSLGLGPLLGAAGTIGLIVAYNVNHKGNPFGPVIMGACRVGLYLTAALSVTWTLPVAVWLGAAVLLLYVLGLTFAAAHENTNALVRYGPLAGLWSPAVVTWSLVLGPMLVKGLFAGFCLWVLRCLRLVRGRASGSIRTGIISLIAGIALVDALLVAHAGRPDLIPFAVLAFGATLALQRLVSGT
ncbi:MAG: UbiA family prenyltransferase [Myxococcota bacterium]